MCVPPSHKLFQLISNTDILVARSWTMQSSFNTLTWFSCSKEPSAMCAFAFTVDCQSLIHSCNSQLLLHHSSRLLLVQNLIQSFVFYVPVWILSSSYHPFLNCPFFHFTLFYHGESCIFCLLLNFKRRNLRSQDLIIHLCGGRTRSCLEQTAEQFSGSPESLPLSWLLLGIREKECCVKAKGVKAVLLKTWNNDCTLGAALQP